MFILLLAIAFWLLFVVGVSVSVYIYKRLFLVKSMLYFDELEMAPFIPDRV
jgi:hypothetical protein